MAKLYKIDGSTKEVSPKNKKVFTLEELRSYIGGGYVECIRIFNKFIVCDEDGLLKHLAVNELATKIYGRHFGPNTNLVGDILIIKDTEIE